MLFKLVFQRVEDMQMTRGHFNSDIFVAIYISHVQVIISDRLEPEGENKKKKVLVVC